MSPTLLTHSRTKCLRRCPKEHYYRYEVGIRPDRDSEPLRIGTAFHAGVEAYGNDEVPAVAVDALYDNVPEWCTSDEDQTAWEVERVIVQELVSGWVARWTGSSVVKTLVAEAAFSFRIGKFNGYRNAGKIDGIVELADGRLALQEIKTTSEDISPGSDYWRWLRFDNQITRYFGAARQLGYDVATVCYDVTKKPGTKPKLISKADMALIAAGGFYGQFRASPEDRSYVGDLVAEHERAQANEKKKTVPKIKETPGLFALRLRAHIADNPDRYYQRMEIPRLTSDLEEFQTSMEGDVLLHRHHVKTKHWPKNDDACMRFGRCAFLDLCSNHVDVSEVVPDGFVRLRDVHPELGGS